MTHTYCAVYKCPSKSRKEKQLKFHKFPRNPKRREAWIEACGRADLKTKTDNQLNNMRVCCLHFERHMYGENQLIDTAVPTLRLPPSSSFSVFTQTETLSAEKKKTTIYREYEVPGVKIKTEVPDTDTNGLNGMEQTVNDSQYSSKRIKIENDLGSGGTEQVSVYVPADVTVEQFLRGCELYLTPELTQYVKTQIIIPH